MQRKRQVGWTSGLLSNLLVEQIVNFLGFLEYQLICWREGVRFKLTLDRGGEDYLRLYCAFVGRVERGRAGIHPRCSGLELPI